MNNYLLNKELDAVKNDKKLIETQLALSKEQMAKALVKQLSHNAIYHSTKMKKKKPFKVRYKEFIHRINILFGFSSNGIK